MLFGTAQISSPRPGHIHYFAKYDMPTSFRWNSQHNPFPRAGMLIQQFRSGNFTSNEGWSLNVPLNSHCFGLRNLQNQFPLWEKDVSCDTNNFTARHRVRNF